MTSRWVEGKQAPRPEGRVPDQVSGQAGQSLCQWAPSDLSHSHCAGGSCHGSLSPRTNTSRIINLSRPSVSQPQCAIQQRRTPWQLRWLCVLSWTHSHGGQRVVPLGRRAGFYIGWCCTVTDAAMGGASEAYGDCGAGGTAAVRPGDVAGVLLRSESLWA
jgi:hypothetical protein